MESAKLLKSVEAFCKNMCHGTKLKYCLHSTNNYIIVAGKANDVCKSLMDCGCEENLWLLADVVVAKEESLCENQDRRNHISFYMKKYKSDPIEDRDLEKEDAIRLDEGIWNCSRNWFKANEFHEMVFRNGEKVIDRPCAHWDSNELPHIMDIVFNFFKNYAVVQ